MDRKKFLINLHSLQLWKAMSPIISLPSPPKVMELLGFACTNSITFTLDQSNPLVMGKQNFYPLQFSMTFFGAIASPSFLSYAASWMDSSPFCVWSIHKRACWSHDSNASSSSSIISASKSHGNLHDLDRWVFSRPSMFTWKLGWWVLGLQAIPCTEQFKI